MNSILNLSSAKPTKGTYTAIREFLYTNRETLSDALKLFYNDVAGILDLQLKKNKARRLSMDQILERAYNIEQYILAAGAADVQVEFVK